MKRKKFTNSIYLFKTKGFTSLKSSIFEGCLEKNSRIIKSSLSYNFAIRQSKLNKLYEYFTQTISKIRKCISFVACSCT